MQTNVVPLVLEGDEHEGFEPVRIDGDVADVALQYFREHVFQPLGSAGEDAWIAGGVLRSWLETRQVQKGDIDVWSVSPKHAEELNAAAKEAGWREKKETDSSYNWETKEGKLWVQIIKRHHFRTAVKTIQSFDFTVCALALSPVRGFICHPQTLQFPRSTLLRTYKYAEKGYRICTGELERLVQALAGTVVAEAMAERNGEEPESRPFQRSGEYPWRGLD